MTNLLTIAQVSDVTGIAKEVLRKWETRYGFPVPVRDALGKRAYTQEQVDRLILIRKLLNDGLRPAQVVALPVSELLVLTARQTRMMQEPATGVVEWLRQRNPASLREQLARELKSRGLLAFVRDLMPAMNTQVGQAWADGAIAVRDEHIYSEAVQSLIWEALGEFVQAEGKPRILLATPTGEDHTLGLLMLEAVLTMESAYCISMGAQSPVTEIAAAADELAVDVVALSFSLAFPKKKIPPLLRELRALLPPRIKLWAGGGGTLGIERKPRGVNFMATLPEALEHLQTLRA
ncbi:MAG: MerR family transcriptional regulator [Burkholderiaceae bacterium]